MRTHCLLSAIEAQRRLSSMPAMIFLALNLTIADASAQTPPFLWAKAVGGTNVDSGRGIAIDTAGNSYITGYFDSTNVIFGNTTLTNSASNARDEIFIAKYDSDGNVLWAKSAGGTTSDSGRGIAVDAQGNCYVTGNFEGPAHFDDTVLTNAAGMFLAKYDGLGNQVWITLASGIPFAVVNGGVSVALDGAANCYVAGNLFGRNAVFGTGTNTITVTNNDGGAAAFVAKFDTDGRVVWAKLGVRANSRSIATDADGNCYATGEFTYSADFENIVITNVNTSGFPDIFVTAYDANGNLLWVKSAGGENADLGVGIAADGSGCWVTGSFVSTNLVFGNVGLTNKSGSGNADAFVTRYDRIGNVVWANSAGGTRSDIPAAIATDGKGNCYATGVYSGPSTFGGIVLTNGGLFLVKYDSAGAVLWAQSGVSANGFAVAADGSGTCYLAGHCFNNATFDAITLTNSGRNSFADILVAKVGFPPVEVRRDANQLVFSWTTNVTGYALESATDFLAPLWTPVTNSLKSVGNRYTVTNSPTGPKKFYRLRK